MGFLDLTQTDAFNANVLSVTGATPVDQNDLIKFAASPALTKKGTGKLTFSVANNLTAKTDLATTVTAGTLEVQNNDSIGLGAITVASGATFIANADMNGRDVNNSGLISVSAGKWFQVESTTGAGNATINNNAALVFNSSSAVNSWKISGTTTAEILPTGNLILDSDNSGFNGNIVPLTGKTIYANTPTALGSGSVDLTGKANVTITYDTTVPAGTVATKFNAGSSTTNVINFNTPNALTIISDSSAFNGTVNINGGAVTLLGAKIGASTSSRNLAINVAADKTLKLSSGASVYTTTATLNANSVLRFDLTGTAPKFDATTLAAGATSIIDITLSSAPASGYLDFTVGSIPTKPLLTISSGFTAAWDGNKIKITANATAPNVTPTTTKFDISTPTNLTFVLSADAFTAAKNGTLSVSVDDVKLASTSYLINNNYTNLTIFSTFLKTLSNGTHKITLENGTTNVGTVTLTVTTSSNVSPTSITFDISNPKNLTFTLGADALTAAQNKTLSITLNGTTVTASNYSFTSPTLTILADYIKNLAIGMHTIQLKNGAANVGTITLHVTNNGYFDTGSSGCNTGAVVTRSVDAAGSSGSSVQKGLKSLTNPDKPGL